MIIDDTEKHIYDTLPNGLRACVDWLSFTINPSEEMSAHEVIRFLGYKPTDFIRMAKGANGYRSMLKLNGSALRVLFDGKENMGVHVDVPSSALSDLLFSWKRKHTGLTPFKTEATSYRDIHFNCMLDLLDALSEIATFTRLDLAIDDIGCSYYSCDDIVKLIEEQRIVSKFRKYDNKMPRLLNNGTKVGHTIYIGSRQSEIMLRIYDKKLEYSSRHNIECPYPWVRWELELKKDRAKEAIKELLKTCSIATVCVGILNQYMRFIQLDNPVKTKCSNDPIWDCFINDINKVSLYVPEYPKCLDDTKKWINKYVGASLSAIIEADEGCLDFIYDNLPKWQEKRERNKDLTNRLKKAIRKGK